MSSRQIAFSFLPLLAILGHFTTGTNASALYTPEWCSDPNHLHSSNPACWDILDITQYLDTWWSQNEGTCNNDPTYQGNGFAYCYQQLHHIEDYNQCNNISLEQCYHPDYTTQTFNTTEYYVLYSIYNVWGWYNTIWRAVTDATFRASLQVGEIVDTIKSDMPKDEPLPGHTPLAAVQQAPGLTKTLLNPGNLQSQVTTLDEIDSELGTVLDQFTSNLADALNQTQRDYDMFLSHLAQVPSLNATTINLARYLKTFVVSQALQSHNIIITVAEDLNPHDLWQRSQSFKNVSDGVMLPQNAWHVNCQEPPDQYGICDNWWVNGITNEAYALFQLDDMEHNFYDLMIAMFQRGWTSGDELFGGAMQCQLHSLYDDGEVRYSEILPVDASTENQVKFPAVDPISLTASCFSNLRKCGWNSTNNLTVRDGFGLSFGGSCTFAWPNLCVDGQGLSTSAVSPFKTNRTLERSDPYALLAENRNLGVGTAIVKKGPSEDLDSQFTHPVVGFGNSIDATAGDLASNKLYDLVNTPLEVLKAQAKSMDHKDCKEYPADNKLPGWGGAGYHLHDSGCQRYPASYLGPGLYFNPQLCGPL